MRTPLLLAIPVVLLACDRTTPVGPDGSAEMGPSYNITPVAEGRMTGGGTVRLLSVDGTTVRVTHGFTLHCDILLSNNLEINWDKNQWHLEKESLQNVLCTDDPNVNPEQPAAPFDTFDAFAVGSFNGVDGYPIRFTLQDGGEPSDDRARMRIMEPGGTVILDVPWGLIVGGNIQAHEDQPHK